MTTTEPTVDDDDAPMQDKFPLTLVLGDAMSTRVLNLLIRNGGRRVLTVSDVCDRVNATTDEEAEEVTAMLNRLQAIGAIDQPSPGLIRYRPNHDALRHLKEADDQMVAELHPDSWYASIVNGDE